MIPTTKIWPKIRNHFRSLVVTKRSRQAPSAIVNKTPRTRAISMLAVAVFATTRQCGDQYESTLSVPGYAGRRVPRYATEN
jgi:hypothetical protein